MAKIKATFGFGVEPEESQNHFFVVIPNRGEDDKVRVYERYTWTQDSLSDILPKDERERLSVYADGQRLVKNDILRIEVSKHKWNLVSKELTAEFNARLKEQKKKIGKFSPGGTPVEKLFGKEMMVLLWGIEDCDPSNIPTALRNWKGLMPEERWWLYTMTNASTGGLYDRRGWRTALRYALCGNPIDEGTQLSISMFGDDQFNRKDT